MAIQVADLEAILELNDKAYKKGMKDAENLSKKTTDKISNDIFTMNNIIKAGFAKLAYEGGQAFIGLGKAAINYTSDLKELENVLSVTFGDRFNAIALNADAMGRAMGRSSLQMRGAVAQAGALGKGLGFVGEDLEQMSIKLAQTAVDMGSFFNVTDDVAFTALRSGLSGETEGMKQFGIVMTENNLKAFALQSGVKKLWKELSEAEKTQIRYNYILEKTSFFQGDAARTINSTANQTKVMQANLGRLYQTIGKEIEPVWNEFLQNLNKTIESFAENEEKGHGFATSIKEIAKAIQTLAVPIEWIIKLMQRLGEINNESVEKMSFDKQYNDIIKNNQEFLKKNKAFFDEKKKQYEDAQKKEQESTIAYNRKQIKAYETTDAYKLEVIKKFNEDKKDLNEYEKAKTLEIYGIMSENTKVLFADMINASGKMKNEVGQNLIDTLEFYVNFTKGMSAELKKQVSVTAALGSARSAVEQGKSLSEAGKIASQTYKLTLGTLGIDTGSQDKLLKEIREKYNYKPFKTSDFTGSNWVNNIKGTSGAVGTGGTGTTTEALTLKELQANYESEKKAFEEYAKQRQLTEEEKNQQLLQINDSYAKQAIDNGWLEYASTLSSNANKLENTIKTNEELKKTQEETKEMIEKAKEDSNDLLNEMTQESADNFIEIGENFLKESEAYDKTFESLQAKIKAEKDYALQQQEIKDNIFKSLGSATTQDELKNSLEELYGKYSDNAEIIEYINSLYPSFLDNLDKQKFTMSDLSNVFSETSKIASELAILFEDDFLGAMSGFLSSAGSLVTNIARRNVLGSISSGLALVNQLDSFLNDSDISEKQEEAYAMFEEAVNEFKKAVEDFSIGEKISYAKLSSPSSLASVSTTSGGVNSGSTSIANYTIASGASDATVDLTGLKNQLTNAGYTDLANQLGNIIGKYAQYSTYYKYGVDKESYISGYDMKGFYAELNTLIQEAWRTNMDNLKEAISLSSNDFIGNMIDVFKSGGEISTSVNDMFYNAVVQAFFNQEAFEALNANLGDVISQKIIEQMTTEGINLGIDFSGMSVSEMLTAYTEIYGSASEKLTTILEGLGIAASSAADELNNVSTKNLPDGLKVATASYQATSANYGSTYQTIYQIENNYSKDFSEMVATAQNQSRFNQTGNARRGY